MTSKFHALALFALCFGCAASLQAVTLFDAFAPLSFQRPVFLTQAPDGSGRYFVVEQDGRIQVFRSGEQQSQVFLDISAKVRTETQEEGLLCMAFHPQFKINRQFYVIYSRLGASPRRTVLSRFRASDSEPQRADPASEQEIFSVEKPFPNHNGSTIAFGKDGFLYISLGDGGSGGDPHGNAQNLHSDLGKILRIDVDHPGPGKSFGIPKDNPFVADKEAKPEIYAYGLRNPWRMGFDPLTGQLWAGDVGQDKWEEVDLIQKGGNYGWNIKEGTHAFKGEAGDKKLSDPVLDYGRNEGFCVTGGYVYRGKRLPELYGSYLFGDYGSKRIWSLPVADPRPANKKEIARSEDAIPSFGQDLAGEVYVLGYGGKIYGLR